MANFRASIRGKRGEASRLGNDTIHSTVNGWNVGVTVTGLKEKHGNRFDIFATLGSDGAGRGDRYIATVIETSGGLFVKFHLPERKGGTRLVPFGDCVKFVD